MTRIVIITRAFPFLPGEQFIEPEAPFWARDEAEVVVMPWRVEGEPRPLPEGVRLDQTLARIDKRTRQFARLRAVAERGFWKEIVWLARAGRLDRATATEVVRAVGGALAVRDALRAWIDEHGPIDVVYTYWWDVWTYGAQLLEGQGVGAVVTRTHRYDLYEDRHPSGYLALKRQLGPRLARLLPISRDAERTVLEVYGIPPRVVQVSTLGVMVPEEMAAPSAAGELHVVSTAMMSPVKRIDLLVEALGLLAAEQPGLRLVWTHFGDGVLREQVDEQVARVLTPLPNVEVSLRGNVDNAVIREHLATAPCDVFVNTSESEGVPVSIMEAMAFGVPALAPAVGGIGELVPAHGPGGELLPAELGARDVAEALWSWRERAKDASERQAARGIVLEGYDAAANYTGLMDLLVGLSRR